MATSLVTRALPPSPMPLDLQSVAAQLRYAPTAAPTAEAVVANAVRPLAPDCTYCTCASTTLAMLERMLLQPRFAWALSRCLVMSMSTSTSSSHRSNCALPPLAHLMKKCGKDLSYLPGRKRQRR